jgi:hypothetical protein
MEKQAKTQDDSGAEQQPRAEQEPKPSIGRIVHYHPFAEGEPGIPFTGEAPPCPAIITKVFSEDCVNLTIFGVESVPLLRTSVLRGGPAAQGSWSWPPRV